MRGVKVLAFDTGGTILDWHGGLVAALADYGTRHGVEHDWHSFANEYRRRALRRMLATRCGRIVRVFPHGGSAYAIAHPPRRRSGSA
jgi:hypothetical protein